MRQIAERKVVLDTDHEHRRQLVIVAGLQPADRAGELTAGPSAEIAVRVGASEAAADIGADVESRPGKRGRRGLHVGRRLVRVGRQIGGICACAGQRRKQRRQPISGGFDLHVLSLQLAA
ncbi:MULTISPECIES: hypothetical protein [unclassified Bradyrhizobium]|uniref:hypothetical protein n=1 Tax=unclassified Bradyrhizobium TaxID=2631580 RepID=UPI0028E6CAAB|nr:MULTISPECIES: hypothetical protein [unclassified Bradyrhizobium]